MAIQDFGEGFWITLAFLAVVVVLTAYSIHSGNEIAKQIASSMVLVVGMVAAFWFPTRGQTGNPPT